MRSVVLATLFLLLVTGAAAPGPGEASSSSHRVLSAALQSRGIAPLPRVLEVTRHAKASQYLDRPGSRVLNANAFAQMRAYVLRRYAGVRVGHSFLDPARRVVDCVPFADQPGVRNRPAATKGAKTPTPPALLPRKPARGGTKISFAQQRHLDLTLRPGKHDQFGNARFCRAGFIPLARTTLTELVRFRTMRSFYAVGVYLGVRLPPRSCNHGSHACDAQRRRWGNFAPLLSRGFRWS